MVWGWWSKRTSTKISQIRRKALFLWFLFYFKFQNCISINSCWFLRPMPEMNAIEWLTIMLISNEYICWELLRNADKIEEAYIKSNEILHHSYFLGVNQDLNMHGNENIWSMVDTTKEELDFTNIVMRQYR